MTRAHGLEEQLQVAAAASALRKSVFWRAGFQRLRFYVKPLPPSSVVTSLMPLDLTRHLNLRSEVCSCSL